MDEKKPKYSDPGLPEDILHHILSYLPMKDVIKTSVLAKRWRDVWLYVPCLNFPQLSRPSTEAIAFINRSLILHKASDIQKLNISLTKELSDRSESYDVQTWVIYAATRNVKELYLNYFGFAKVVLPHRIFRCGSLTVLKLCGCVISAPAGFKLTSLRSLTLERISRGWEHANSILASSPNVEHLSLTNCLDETSGKVELSIMNAGVKTLNIAEFGFESPGIKVNAPFVVSFDLLTGVHVRNIVLTRMKSLESVTLAFSRCDARNYALKILYNVRSVKSLRLSVSGFKAISEIDARILGMLSFKFTHLELSTEEGLSKAQQGRIASVLKLSPKIRTLVIIIKGFKKTVTKPDGGHLKLKDPDVLKNLETVQIYDLMIDLYLDESKQITDEELLGEIEDDLSFIEILLKTSKALKSMTIKFYKHLRIGQRHRMKLQPLVSKRLLASAKASGVGISLIWQ